ncbi:MAG: class I SAM-dependent methyltransferase, partial [Bacteroidetes bacterium]|nr:class I SAM-dependent methyltransferase [Bacteroidota bacterium]
MNTPVGVPNHLTLSAWLEHGPFAMWLVRRSRPRSIVELGSHLGYSYFCMCQAVVEDKLATKCYAIDTWQGDEHAGLYDEEIYNQVKKENDKYTSFSTLIRKTFSEALSDIEDNSVDLLHVDGRHYYDDVKEDFESWIPKLSDRALVLFHDTEVYERDFGVHRYWAEISQKYPSFNFQHGNGLGVLFFGQCMSEGAKSILKMIRKEVELNSLCDYFAAQGALVSSRYQIEVSEVSIDKRRGDLETIKMLSGNNQAKQILEEYQRLDSSLYNEMMQQHLIRQGPKGFKRLIE